MIRAAGIGAGGHAKVIIEVLRAAGGVELVGMLDRNPELWGRTLLGVPVLGSDDLIPKLASQGVTHVFIGVGSVGDTGARTRLYHAAVAAGLQPLDAIHPSAIISPTARIGRGVTIMPNVVINADATLGQNVIVNTAAIVEHDCVIGDHVHIASGARLASTVKVGEGSHIGLGAAIRQCIRIGRNVTVGAGAVVVHDVEDGDMVVGVPAKPVRHRSPSGV